MVCNPAIGSALADGANSASTATGANISQRLAEKCRDLIGCLLCIFKHVVNQPVASTLAWFTPAKQVHFGEL